MAKDDLFKMSLGDHIEELRSCLVRSLIGIAVALVITFTFGFYIIGWIAEPMLGSLQAYGYSPQLYTSSPTLGFTDVYIPVSLIAAAILASPWIIWQLWRFISAGLYAHERKVAYLLAPFSTIMTILGVSFTYYILLPVCLMFFIRWSTYYPQTDQAQPNWLLQYTMGVGDHIEPPVEYDARPLRLPVLEKDPEPVESGMVWVDATEDKIKIAVGGKIRSAALMPENLLAPLPDLGSFIRFAAMMGLGVVIAFQLPVFMLVVGWTGIIDPDFIARYRKYALFIAFLIGAILTPAELFSMFVLAVPLYALFEFGLLIMRRVYRAPAYPDDT